MVSPVPGTQLNVHGPGSQLGLHDWWASQLNLQLVPEQLVTQSVSPLHPTWQA
ncbi:MAG TPA: hypothetical protein VGG91_04850 [Myxococcaceae bacterium]